MQDSTHDGSSFSHSQPLIWVHFPLPTTATVLGLRASSCWPADNRRPSVVAQEANLHTIAGDYIDHRTTTVKHVHVSSGKATLDRLEENIASGAIHDSDERSGAPKCLPQTRVVVQTEIFSWIRHGGTLGGPRRTILWITGPAGTGKSAIAGTLADRCQKEGLLAASYFFSASSRSPIRRSKKALLLTIIYQLLQHESICGLKEEVLSAIENNPVVFKKTLDQQLEELVLAPLRRVAGKSDPSRWPTAIIVDAVDECGADALDKSNSNTSHTSRRSKEENHIEILSVLARAAADPFFPFRIVVVSRPEPAIRGFFDTCLTAMVEVFLDDKYNPDADIALFLEAKFSEIRRQFNLPSSWPSQDVIKLLVREASGQFIHAETIIRFVGDDTTHPPPEQLNRILGWRSINTTNPYAALHALYTRILKTSPNPTLAMEWLLTLQESDPEDAWYTKALLESSPGEGEFLLKNLASLVGINNENGMYAFHFYHKSFLDFLKDEARVHQAYGNHHTRIEAIKRERYYRVLKHRGPQGTLNDPIHRQFVAKFCRRHVWHVETRRSQFNYTPSDVEWWIDNLEDKERLKALPQVFNLVHDTRPGLA